MYMKESIFKKWIKAIKSGKYEISTDTTVLVKIDGDKHIFHPLAVLADIAPINICDFGEEVHDTWADNAAYVPVTYDRYGCKYITTIPNNLAYYAGISTRCAGESYVSHWPKSLGNDIDKIIEWMKENM